MITALAYTALLALLYIALYALRRFLRARKQNPVPDSTAATPVSQYTRLSATSARTFTVHLPDAPARTLPIAWLDADTHYPPHLNDAACAVLNERLKTHPQPLITPSSTHPAHYVFQDPDGYLAETLVHAGLARWRPETLPFKLLLTAAHTEDRARFTRRGRWDPNLQIISHLKPATTPAPPGPDTPDPPAPAAEDPEPPPSTHPASDSTKPPP